MVNRKRKVRKLLIIEGASDTTYGQLRQGFNKLLSQKLAGNMPRIIMGEGRNQAIDKYLNSDNSFLLLDLDGPEATRDQHISEHKLNPKPELVFYMIQEMEAWFISQPEILDAFYDVDISQRLPQRPASEIPNPCDKLEYLTKPTRKGRYHKINHAVPLLEKLDANQLSQDFPDFKSMIEALRQ